MLAVRTPSLVVTRRLPPVSAVARALAPAALLAAVGVELAVLAAYLPETIERWWEAPHSDFHNLYERSRALDLMGLYNPVLTPLLYPLARLPETPAYRAFFALNAAAVLATAYLAQRPLRSPEARLAAALAVVSLPQMQWALRLGHTTPLLALAAAGGFLLLRERPRAAGLALSVLSFKPQYAAAPLLYLLWRRERRAALWMCGAAGAMAVAGFAVAGPGSPATFASDLIDWGANTSDDLLPVQQGWLTSWPGVQRSLGFESHPLVTADLLLLSLGVAVVAWVRTDAATGAAAAALAMLPLTPYAQFYDGCLIVAGFVLLARSGLRPWLSGGIIAALYAAALVTQANTVFPTRDLLADAHTDGVFWLTPALLATLALMAFAGRRGRQEEA